MASIKIAVTELSAKKAAYTKAARNLREIMQTLTKARNSIGNDKMVQHAKEALKKLVDLLDRRAFELEALAQVIGTSADGYKSTQKNLTRVVSDFKAHKTDFYGQPVHVSGASGGGAAAAASAATASAAPAASSSSTASEASFTSTSTTSGSVGAGNVSAGSSSPENVTINNTYNETNVYVNASSNGPVDMPVSSGISANAAAAMNAAGPSIPSGGAAASSVGSSIGAGAIGAGIGAAAAASAIGAAGVISNKRKNKKEAEINAAVDDRLERAKQKLSMIENEQEMIQASLAEEE